MTVFANILQPLIDFFQLILEFFHENVGLGWGASIIAMTVVIRAALLPLTLKQFKSMQSLARHQPELKRLQEKYKGDKDRMNQEMMKFYRENKINPLASCLPLLAQFPVFISLFYLLQDDLRYEICPDKQAGRSDPVACGQTDASEFFFIPDLTDEASGSVLIVLILLYVTSQLFSTILSSMQADKTQRMIFIALPFLFVPFIINFPAGLLVYWITTNLWTIVQQGIVRKRLGPMRPPGSEPPPGLGDLFKRAQEKAAGPATPAPVAAGAGGGSSPKGRPAGPPPSPPRKKKKRSGRRR